MLDLTLHSIRETVGESTATRGIDYARHGHVLSVYPVERDGRATKLFGIVQGTAPQPYSVIVSSIAVRNGTLSVTRGTCTCPMAANCKHVAAVMYAASVPAAQRRAGGEIARVDTWDQILRLPPAEDPQESPTRCALLIEPHDAGARGVQLPMRPLQLNERGRWVSTGMSWNRVGNVYRGDDSPAMRLLWDIYALSGTMDSYYHYDQSTIDLRDFPSERIWGVLGQAPTVGLPLLGSRDGAPVVVESGCVTPTLEVGAAGDAWQVAPLLLSPDGDALPDGALLLGDPFHGVAWFAPAADGRRALHLSALARPLDPEASRLFGRSDPITVPRTDRPRFVREFLPVLRSRFEVVASGPDVDLPTPQPARLTVICHHDSAHQVSVRWVWRETADDEVHDVPLQDAHLLAVRDRDAEGRSLDDAVEVAASVPPLVGTGPMGTYLVAAVDLAGMDAVRFERWVLAALRDLDTVDVEIVGGGGTFSESEDPPIITVAGAHDSDGDSPDWLDLAVSVTVAGEEVPFADLFRALATGQEILVLPSGTYFTLDRPELHQLRTLIEESWQLADADGNTLRLSKFQVSFWDELESLGVVDEQVSAWTGAVRRLAGADGVPEAPVPDGLHATLRPYQAEGFSWLAFLYTHGLGGVLADDMGLGKTVQTLALICYAREQQPDGAPFLVVAPTSVVGNWVAEAHKFAPTLRTVGIVETEARRGVPLAEVCAGADVVVTSYALFRLDFERYERVTWSGLLLDEAQNVKNYQSKGYQCVRRLRVPFRVVITGTPMENNLMELWAMFSICAPGLLGDPKRFTEFYRKPIERAQDSGRLELLRKRIRPLLMRRTKQEVVAELPPKIEQVMELTLEPRHRRAYQRFLQRERRKILGLLGDFDSNRMTIFRSLTLLRQAALDASLVDEEHAAVPSTKLDALMRLLSDVTAEGHRVLIFSQFTSFLGRARDRLDAAGIAYSYLDGSSRRRAEIVDGFRSGTAPVFLISLKAGGVGLNLTEADYCILLDPWWNPATEAQAIDRTHRIGQDKPVMVYRLVARDTIEEKVMALKARKAALFSSIMDGGGVGTGGLTAQDIRGLLE